MSESRVTWATSVPILVFLGLCSRIRPDVRDRQTSDVRHKHRLMSPPIRGGGITTQITLNYYQSFIFRSVLLQKKHEKFVRQSRVTAIPSRRQPFNTKRSRAAEELWSSKPPPKLTDRVGCCQACVHGVQSSVDCCQTHALSPILVYWTPWSMSLTDDQFQFFCRNGAAIALSAKALAMSECAFYRYRIVRAPHFTRISFVMCFGQIFDSFQYFWIRQPISWI